MTIVHILSHTRDYKINLKFFYCYAKKALCNLNAIILFKVFTKAQISFPCQTLHKLTF